MSLDSSFDDTPLPPPDIPPAADLFLTESRREFNQRLVSDPINDLGNAEIFVLIYTGELLFTPEWGGWMFYNGRYWEKGEYHALDRAGDVIKRRIAAFHAHKAIYSEKVLKRLDACGNAARLTGLLRLAESKMHMPAANFDADPYLLNTGNGVVNIKTGALFDHSPDYLITRFTPVRYVPGAQSPLWNDTVRGIACGDIEMIDFLQCLAGYSVSGDVSLQRFFYLLGSGSNGKSLLTSLWAEALGGFGDAGYTVKVPNETILSVADRAAGAPSPDLLALKGRRMALVSEQRDDYPMNTERIKDLTGGDAITARAPHREPVTFSPSFSLICSGNHIPHITATDHGFWRRLLVVPFMGRFEPSRLGEELRSPENLTAILAWMVEGARLLHERGLLIPKAIEVATENCRRESNPLQVWIDDCCEGGEDDVSILFASFGNWCAVRHERSMSQGQFTRNLKHLNYTARKSNGKKLIKGLHLKQATFPR